MPNKQEIWPQGEVYNALEEHDAENAQLMSSLGDRREEVHDQRCKVAIAEPNLRHVERHVAQSRRQKLGRGYITNQSQLLHFPQNRKSAQH